MTLESYAPQLPNCFLPNDSWDIYAATFKLLPSKWLLRCKHRNFQTASFLATLETYALQLLIYALLPSKWLLRYIPQLSNCFLSNDSWDIFRNFQTAFFQMTLEIYTPQLSNCFLLNDSWDICTATFKLLLSKWLLRYMHRNFRIASFLMNLEIYAP